MATKNRSGRVEKESGEYNVYDANGKFIGWTHDLDLARRMAETGFTNNPMRESIGSELSVWSAWNDAVDSGQPVLANPDGNEQICYLHSHVFIVAAPNDCGWEVELVSVDDLWGRYGVDDELIGLVVADKPYRLE